MKGDLMQNEHEVIEGAAIPEGDAFPDTPAFINYNFKFWDACQRGGHDFVKRKSLTVNGEELPPQCAVCGTIYSELYRETSKKHGNDALMIHMFGGAGWCVPTVKPTRKAVMRFHDSPILPSTISDPGQNTERPKKSRYEGRYGGLVLSTPVIDALKIVWPIFLVIPHRHVWREMHGDTDYGRWGRHWGNYHGIREDECILCGKFEDTQKHQPTPKGLAR